MPKKKIGAIFLSSLKRGDDFTQNPQSLIETFCENYWQLEKHQQECYDVFVDYIKVMYADNYKLVIPLLIDKSKICNNFILLVKELFDTLPPEAQKSIDIPTIYWTQRDEETEISKAEYIFRQKNGQKCWQNNDKEYCRPVTSNDLVCFRAFLDIMFLSGTKSLMLIG